MKPPNDPHTIFTTAMIAYLLLNINLQKQQGQMDVSSVNKAWYRAPPLFAHAIFFYANHRMVWVWKRH